MDFEAQEQGEVDEIMAPREDLLGYDDDELAEDDADVHSMLHDAQAQQAADEEEGNFRCVTKTRSLAASINIALPPWSASDKLQQQQSQLGRHSTRDCSKHLQSA